MSIHLGSIQYDGLANNLEQLEENRTSYGYTPLDSEHIKTCLENHKVV